MRELTHTVANQAMGFLFYPIYLPCMHPITIRSILAILPLTSITVVTSGIRLLLAETNRKTNYK